MKSAVLFGKYHGVDLICPLQREVTAKAAPLQSSASSQTHWCVEGRPSSLGLVTDLGVDIVLHLATIYDFFFALFSLQKDCKKEVGFLNLLFSFI